MSKRINHYEFPGRSPEIEDLQRLFKRHLSKFNVPFFEAGSDTERVFLDYCRKGGFPVQGKSVVEYEPNKRDRGNDAVDYLYLTLKDDRGLCIPPEEGVTGFIDTSAGCPGGPSFGICQRGAKQICPPAVPQRGLQLLEQFDFVVAQWPLVAPKIYLLSQRIARIVESAKATGCEIAPCDAPSPCYQLRILARTWKPVKVGHAKISRRCPVCGSIRMGIFSRERYFHPGDLKSTDFQLCDWYESDNTGTFTIPFGFPIISRRMFDLLYDNRVKGLDRYTTDPPVKYAAVQVEPKP